MKIHNSWYLVLTLLAACSSGSLSESKSAAEPKPVVANTMVSMQKVTGLKTPESVVQALNGNIYVTEINGFDVDGDGQITVIENGKARVFVTGLDDPKGIVAIKDNLYVADKTKVLKITTQGDVSTFVPSTAFPSVPVFLNDIEADTFGNLYVSDTGKEGVGAAIYKITPQGNVSLVISHAQNALVKAPNGLLMDDTGDVIVLVDFSSGVLYSYNMKTAVLTDLAEGFGNGDGIVHHSSGTMFVSDWGNGKVFSVALNGEVKLIKSGYVAAADMALTKDEKYLMVPDFKGGALDFIEVSEYLK